MPVLTGGTIVTHEMAAARPPPGAPSIKVTIANVWFDWMEKRRVARRAGASGMLDHFMLVVPAAAGTAGAGAAAAGGSVMEATEAGAGRPALKRLRRMAPETPVKSRP